MSRSKKDIRETEAMLSRLEALLREQGGGDPSPVGPYKCRDDAEALRRISMTLHRWHELECGTDNGLASYCLVRGRKTREVLAGGSVRYGFEYAEDSDAEAKPFLEIHPHNSDKPIYSGTQDREKGARKRLASILKRYPGLSAYVQTDPRGCALYILKPGDVPEGEDVSAYYSRGLAVHQ